MRASDDLCTWLLFFFSSRRRHTRLVSDWSSDVCSSDLDKGALPGGEGCFGFLDLALQLGNRQLVGMPALGLVLLQRSEERRVGKEGRCRWAGYQEKEQESATDDRCTTGEIDGRRAVAQS